ncbi:MAG: TonB-dependent receptor [Candidatus Latescibacterota bacterium]
MALQGTVVDLQTREPVAGAAVRLRAGEPAAERGTVTDSAGAFRLEDLAPGPWSLEVEALGYEGLRQPLRLHHGEVDLTLSLRVRPLVLDELVVRARRAGGEEVVPAFVERIRVDRVSPGLALADLLEQAVGVQVRRRGGEGSFSTLSIRGSTAEQVLVYLDGVPLNQALGGGVNVGDLPIAGVESVEVYRGAVPVRFGGNSIGGVVQVRTRPAAAGRQVRLQGGLGSFGARQVGLSGTGEWAQVRFLGLADYGESRNDFRFLDDNGTEYNAADDEWTRRINSGFRSLRGLAKAEYEGAGVRLRLHTTQLVKGQGIPGIGNYQATHVQSDLWRSVTEAEAAGLLAASGHWGYRLGLCQLLQREEYRDLYDEVGTGTQHDQNTTASTGLRAQVSGLLVGGTLLTAEAGLRRESFSPHDRLRPQARLLDSGRTAGQVGLEGQVGILGDRAQLTGGVSAEANRDRFHDQGTFATSELRPRKRNTEMLHGRQVGLRLAPASGWTLKAHWGRYQRAPSFYELFGDRGAVIGNTDLSSETGTNRDLGLAYRPEEEGLVQVLEIIGYANDVRDMIRFVQNSQRVSRPQNIGRARIRGLEATVLLRPVAAAQLGAGYSWQHARDRSPFTYHRGKDLPNAPRHALHLRAALVGRRGNLHYEVDRDSGHFLDRANLRPVPARLLHSAGGGVRLWAAALATWEVRNLTANQAADLWGYPLPGRSVHLSLAHNLEL